MQEKRASAGHGLHMLVGLPSGRLADVILFGPYRQPPMMNILPLIRTWSDAEEPPVFNGRAIGNDDEYNQATVALFHCLCASRGIAPPHNEDFFEDMVVLNGGPKEVFVSLSQAFGSLVQDVKSQQCSCGRFCDCIKRAVPGEHSDHCQDIERLAAVIESFVIETIAAHG